MQCKLLNQISVSVIPNFPAMCFLTKLVNCCAYSICQVGNLAAPVEEWTVGGTALTSLMDVERRHGRVHLAIFFGLCYLSHAGF